MEAIKEGGSSHKESLKSKKSSRAQSSRLKSERSKKVHHRELKEPPPPRENLVLTPQKEKQFNLRIKHIGRSEQRQGEEMKRLEQKIEEIEEERTVEKKKYKKTMEILRYVNKRIKKPMRELKKEIEGKEEVLQE